MSIILYAIRLFTHTLLQKIAHLLSKLAKIDGVAVPSSSDNQLLLTLVSNEFGAKLFGMSIDTNSYQYSRDLKDDFTNALDVQLGQD